MESTEKHIEKVQITHNPFVQRYFLLTRWIHVLKYSFPQGSFYIHTHIYIYTQNTYICTIYIYIFIYIWWLRRWRIHLQCKRPRFDPWVGKIPWRREWQPTPAFLPGEFQGQWSLAGYCPWGHKELDTTEWLTLTNYIYLLFKPQVGTTDKTLYLQHVLFTYWYKWNISPFH